MIHTKWNITIDKIIEDVLNLPDSSIKIIGDIRKHLGRKTPPPPFETNFWDKFPGLLFDDPEDEHNEIIGILRDAATKYFKDKEK